MPARRNQKNAHRQGLPRRASILVVVLVVLCVLTLGAYTFSEFMLVEAQATSMYGRGAQARAAADSGIELVSSLLTQRYQQGAHTYYNNPEWFQGVLLQEAESARGRCRFSVVSAVENDVTGRMLRFGVTDESSRININAIPKLITDHTQARTFLKYLPDMTDEIADAILDWIDTDKTMREMGAEDETYTGLGYMAKNGPLDSLDELLQVRGVTPWMLFGEDANRNGLLDFSENDGELNPPLDNGDGLLNRGWSAYLTVHSRESNFKTDGTQKINVNMSSLANLYDQIQPILGNDAAQFVIAYRSAGPVATSSGSGQQSSSGSTASRSGGGGASGGTGAKTTTATDASVTQNAAKITTSQDKSQAVNGAIVTNSKNTSTKSQAAGQAAGVSGSSATMAGGASATRAGIDVSKAGSTQITSLYQLIDAQVSITLAGSNRATKLSSPWTSDSSSLRTNLPRILDALSIKPDKYILGRINVNHARREVMMGIPNMPPTAADAIVNAQATAPVTSDPNSDRATTGWLLMNGIVDLPTMQAIDPYITAGGDVFHLQSVGYYEKGGPSARIEAVIDATQDPPTVLFMRDLTDLGRGFSAQSLTTGSGSAQ
jgi:uncharacterized membrane protein YgcG